MKEVYIVLTSTGTALSNIIIKYKHAEYGHVSISLDKELDLLYSFGRIHPYNAFCGRLVHEGIHFGTFKRFKDTKCKIYRLTVDEEQHQLMKSKIEEMLNRRPKYKFNIRGLFLAAFNRRIPRNNHFYCSEFVRYILEKGNVDVTNLPSVVQPDDMRKIKGLKLIYEGLLRDYN